MDNQTAYVFVFDGFADWEPASALAATPNVRISRSDDWSYKESRKKYGRIEDSSGYSNRRG